MPRGVHKRKPREGEFLARVEVHAGDRFYGWSITSAQMRLDGTHLELGTGQRKYRWRGQQPKPSTITKRMEYEFAWDEAITLDGYSFTDGTRASEHAVYLVPCWKKGSAVKPVGTR